MGMKKKKKRSWKKQQKRWRKKQRTKMKTNARMVCELTKEEKLSVMPIETRIETVEKGSQKQLECAMEMTRRFFGEVD